MSWRVVIPFKGPGARKTRLSQSLSDHERDAAALRMFHHVAEVVRTTSSVREFAVLSDSRPAGWEGPLLEDRGLGLNAELQAIRDSAMGERLLILHADLPHLRPHDIAALIGGAERSGVAIAPDRREVGTNAIALLENMPFRFEFGAASFRPHLRQAPKAMIVRTPTLGLDIDTPEDLALAAID